jgi:two-component system, LytTR family, response regulator
MTVIRTVLVDDEPPARRKVRRFLESEPDIEVVAEAGTGEEAVDAVIRARPDLLFLDVQIPEPDGFGVLEVLREGGEPLPCVIFATAHDSYAIRAFDVHALDYLLKPFDVARFRRALDHARTTIAARRGTADDERIRRLLEEVRPARPALDRVLVRKRGRGILLRLADVDWIEAARNYVTLHAGDDSFLVRGTLAEFEARLDPVRFVRIHRFHIVNVDRVAELHPWSHGDWIVLLRDGTRLTLSRRFRHHLDAFGPGAGR